MDLWITSNSNLGKLHRLQNKVLRAITKAPCYVPNRVIAEYLQISSVKEETKHGSARYTERLTSSLRNVSPTVRRLKLFKSNELVTRFRQK